MTFHRCGLHQHIRARARKTNWDYYYSGSHQINEYFKDIVAEHNLMQYCRLNSKIIDAEWLGDQGQWKVTVMHDNDPSKITIDHAEFFIHGGGVLKYFMFTLLMHHYLLTWLQQLEMAANSRLAIVQGYNGALCQLSE